MCSRQNQERGEGRVPLATASPDGPAIHLAHRGLQEKCLASCGIDSLGGEEEGQRCEVQREPKAL